MLGAGSPTRESSGLDLTVGVAQPGGAPTGTARWSPPPLPEGVATAGVLFLVWIALIAASIAYRGSFASRETVLSVTFTMAVAGVLTVAQSLVTLSGGVLDLSIPTALVLPAWVMAILLGHGVEVWLAVATCLVVGMLWGGLNATIIVLGKLNPIIVTLATNFGGIAILNIYVNSPVIPIHSGLAQWGRGYFLTLPNVFWPMVALVVLLGYLLPRTQVGRRVIAVGGNPQAAKMRGISLKKVRYGVFMTAGLFAGLAATLFTASQATFTAADGNTYLFTSIAATLVAGIGLSGGYGNIWVTFLSVGLLSTIPTSLAFFGVPTLWQEVPPGAIVVVAVAFDGYRRLRAAR